MRVFCVIVALGLAAPSVGWARSFRVGQIPSAPESCDTCHTSGGGSPRNPFGRDVEATLSAGDVDWPAVCPLDSDGDGSSNGEELGDPDCGWTPSDGRLTAISLPGDATSFPGSPEPDPEAGDQAGGCGAVSPSLLGLLVASGLLRRRGRRTRRA